MEFKFSRKVRTKQNDKKEFQWGFKLPQKVPFPPSPISPNEAFHLGSKEIKKKKIIKMLQRSCQRKLTTEPNPLC